MSESVDEVCKRCGRVTLVLVGDGSTYIPVDLCDECVTELNDTKRQYYDDICS